MAIRIVTDSTCDLPDEFINQYQITVIPNILIIDGQAFLDGIELSREEFYDRMVDMKTVPTTATASAGTYRDIYNRLLDQGADHILSIHPASSLTGICNAARAGSDQDKEKVTIIDSGQVSLGLGFQVAAAASAIEEGCGIDDILQRIQNVRSRLRVLAMFDTLEYVKRSGRISWTRFRLASLLQIRAIIELRDGILVNRGEYRTRKKSIVQLRSLLDQMGSLESLAILHTNADEEARSFLKMVSNSIENHSWICNVTTIIGTHVGPNALGFAAVAQKAPAFS